MQIEINDNEVTEARHLLKCLDSELIPVKRLKSFLKKFERKVSNPSAQKKRNKNRDTIEMYKTKIVGGIR